jgi:hypothetical protein
VGAAAKVAGAAATAVSSRRTPTASPSRANALARPTGRTSFSSCGRTQLKSIPLQRKTVPSRRSARRHWRASRARSGSARCVPLPLRIIPDQGADRPTRSSPSPMHPQPRRAARLPPSETSSAWPRLLASRTACPSRTSRVDDDRSKTLAISRCTRPMIMSISLGCSTLGRRTISPSL